MFDIGWSELFVIAVVAVIVVGPKDLPKMLRTFGNWVARMKRMAGEFQGQFNEALREAELEDVKKSIEDIGKIDPLADVRSAMDSANQIGGDIQREMEKPVGSAAAAIAGATTATAEPQLPPATVETAEALAPPPAAGVVPAAAAEAHAAAHETHSERPPETAGTNRA